MNEERSSQKDIVISPRDGKAVQTFPQEVKSLLKDWKARHLISSKRQLRRMLYKLLEGLEIRGRERMILFASFTEGCYNYP